MKEALKSILSDKEYKDGLHVQQITDLMLILYPDLVGDLSREQLSHKVNTILLKESRVKGGEFSKGINPKTRKPRRGVYRYNSRKRSEPLPQPPIRISPHDIICDQNNAENSTSANPSTSYFGKAGEYAVMSELLFLGFNANNMTVDDGIDIIASKDNNFYFIQVKTVTLKPNRTASAKIRQKNFDKFINQQIRYVIAVKCDKEIRFFTLSNDAIRLLHHSKALSISEKTRDISIKIRYDENSGRPIFYDEREMDASFWEGFERIEATPIL